jgi:hypothetical protein
MIILVACFAVGAVVAVLWPREREPVYEGKKLSEWLVQIRGRDASMVMAAQDALRAIGTNALPVLLKWVRHEEPAWRGALHSWMTKGPVKIRARWIEDTLSPTRALRPDWLALGGFRALGPMGQPAVPGLHELIHDGSKYQARTNAMLCFVLIGEPMELLLNDADPWVRAAATNAFLKIAPEILPKGAIYKWVE